MGKIPLICPLIPWRSW